MPLQPGKSPKVVSANIATESQTRSHNQAVAIALSNARRHPKKQLVSPTGIPLNGPSSANNSQWGAMSIPGARRKPGEKVKARYTPQQVAYTSKSTVPNQACAMCWHFSAPSGCDVLTANVTPDGWCEVYMPRSEPQPQNKSIKLYQSPHRLPFWRKTVEILGKRYKEGVNFHRASDGARYLFLITSNSYEDREGETLTTHSLKQYVESAWKGKSFVADQPVYFWHDEDLPPIGKIVWADMQGPFLIEVAKEAPNAFARKIFDYVEVHPKGWGTSHGFDYPESLKDNKDTYHKIYKFETSLLPLWAASNPYTLSAVIGG